MTTPVRYDLHAVRGATFSQAFTFYQDAGQTLPFSLAGYTATVVGLPTDSVSVSGSSVTFTMSKTTTVNLGPANIPYAVQLTDPSGNVTFPVNGFLNVSDPLLA